MNGYSVRVMILAAVVVAFNVACGPEVQSPRQTSLASCAKRGTSSNFTIICSAKITEFSVGNIKGFAPASQLQLNDISVSFNDDNKVIHGKATAYPRNLVWELTVDGKVVTVTIPAGTVKPEEDTQRPSPPPTPPPAPVNDSPKGKVTADEWVQIVVDQRAWPRWPNGYPVQSLSVHIDRTYSSLLAANSITIWPAGYEKFAILKTPEDLYVLAESLSNYSEEDVLESEGAVIVCVKDLKLFKGTFKTRNPGKIITNTPQSQFKFKMEGPFTVTHL